MTAQDRTDESGPRGRLRSILRRAETLHWGNLRSLGSNHLVTTSYFWLVFVPLVARWLGPFAGTHKLTVPFAEPITVHIDLPFSWICFWHMSIFFAVGQVIYTLQCPAIVKRFADYGEYRSAHTGGSQLLNLADQIVRDLDDSMVREFTDKILTTAMKFSDAPPMSNPHKQRQFIQNHTRDLITTQTDSSAYDARLSNSFDFLLDAAQRQRRKYMWASAVAFSFGLALFGWFLVENVTSAIQAIYFTQSTPA